MPNDEKAARAFLEGLKKRKAPWDDGYESEAPAARPAARPSPKPPAKPRSTADDAMSQAERIAKRNREVAKRTRYLREN